MKFNFRKIASVITSTVMLSSTIAFAAAANFPAPFVSGGAGDVAVVYGANAPAGVDYATVLNINSKLNSAITSNAPAVISGTDVVSLDRASTLLHLGGNTTYVFGRSITDADMPTLLADGVFTSYGDNKDHEFTQKIDVSNLIYTYFEDSNYDNGNPSLGVQITSGAEIANYTLTFSDKPAIDQMDNSDITIMGKDYLVVDATNTTLTLLDSANTQSFNEGETKTVQIGGTSYDVTVTDVSSTPRVKVSVGGKTSSSLAVGSTYKVAEGVYVGVKDISYKSKDTAVSTAELAFGVGKMVLTDDASVQLNDQSISDNNNDDVVADIQNVTGTLSKVVLQWKASEDRFITGNSSVVMPGFNSVKISSTGMTFAESEEVSIDNDGKYTIQLQAPIKDGDITLNLLSNNQTHNGNYTIIGKDNTKKLITAASGNATFDSDTDENLVVTWAGSKDAETYVLYANSFRVDSGINKTQINKRVGSFSQDVQAGDQIILGDAVLTVGQVSVNQHSVVLIPGSGVNFNTLYTKGGLKVNLPVPAGADNAVNITAEATTYQLKFEEADKDGTLGNGDDINVTLGLTSTNKYVSATAVTIDSGMKEIGSSNIYEGYAYSDLATKASQNQGPDQNTVTLTYHKGESSAKIYVSDVSSTVIGGGSSGLAVSDSEISSVQGKNLIVVGGSCVNTVAAKLLGSETPLCGADWQSATGVGAGSFLIQTFTSPYASSKIATLVAGYNAEDTTAAGKYLTTQTLDVSAVGYKKTLTTAETQSLV